MESKGSSFARCTESSEGALSPAVARAAFCAKAEALTVLAKPARALAGGSKPAQANASAGAAPANAAVAAACARGWAKHRQRIASAQAAGRAACGYPGKGTCCRQLSRPPEAVPAPNGACGASTCSVRRTTAAQAARHIALVKEKHRVQEKLRLKMPELNPCGTTLLFLLAARRMQR